MDNGTEFSYWNIVSDKASQSLYIRSTTTLDRLIAEEEGTQADPDAALFSFETNPDNHSTSMLSFAHEHTSRFLALLTILDPEYQEMCVGYYLLGKTEEQLGRIYGRSQSVTGYEIKACITNLAMSAALGEPTRDNLRTILDGCQMETMVIQDKTVSLSHLLYLFIQTRSFKDVADVFRIHRPHIRRLLPVVAERLTNSKNVKEAALGHLINRVLYRSDPATNAPKERQYLKLQDPPVVGSFEIDVTAEGFDHLFTSESDPRF
jgi:hypothetical protein